MRARTSSLLRREFCRLAPVAPSSGVLSAHTDAVLRLLRQHADYGLSRVRAMLIGLLPGDGTILLVDFAVLHFDRQDFVGSVRSPRDLSSGGMIERQFSRKRNANIKKIVFAKSYLRRGVLRHDRRYRRRSWDVLGLNGPEFVDRL